MLRNCYRITAEQRWGLAWTNPCSSCYFGRWCMSAHKLAMIVLVIMSSAARLNTHMHCPFEVLAIAFSQRSQLAVLHAYLYKSLLRAAECSLLQNLMQTFQCASLLWLIGDRVAEASDYFLVPPNETVRHVGLCVTDASASLRCLPAWACVMTCASCARLKLARTRDRPTTPPISVPAPREFSLHWSHWNLKTFCACGSCIGGWSLNSLPWVLPARVEAAVLVYPTDRKWIWSFLHLICIFHLLLEFLRLRRRKKCWKVYCFPKPVISVENFTFFSLWNLFRQI